MFRTPWSGNNSHAQGSDQPESNVEPSEPSANAVPQSESETTDRHGEEQQKPPTPTPEREQNQNPSTGSNQRRAKRSKENQRATPLSEGEPHAPVTTRTGRTISRPLRYVNTVYTYLSTFSPQCMAKPKEYDEFELLSETPVALTTDSAPPHLHGMLSNVSAYMAGSRDPDTMTLEEAMKQPDRKEFIAAMKKELLDHITRKHWKVVKIESLPQNRVPIPMVWSMKRKRDPAGNIIKWKGRLCAGGHKQVHGIDFWSTYSPVVAWSTVRLVITLALVHGWHMESIDFVLAYPQAPCQSDVFLKPPKVPAGFEIPDLPDPRMRSTHVYKLLQNLYGLKDAGRTWYLHITKGLQDLGWTQSKVDCCLFTKGDTILLLYVDDAVLISPQKSNISKHIEDLSKTFVLTAEGPLHDYLGIRVTRSKDGTITLTQPRLVERVCQIVGLDTKNDNVKAVPSPAESSKILQRFPNSKVRKYQWNYRAAVGCLSYLQAMTRPDITYAVQQAARFSHCPAPGTSRTSG